MIFVKIYKKINFEKNYWQKIGYKIVTFGFARFYLRSFIFAVFNMLYWGEVMYVILIFKQNNQQFCEKVENSYLCGKLCGKCGKALKNIGFFDV